MRSTGVNVLHVPFLHRLWAVLFLLLLFDVVEGAWRWPVTLRQWSWIDSGVSELLKIYLFRRSHYKTDLQQIYNKSEKSLKTSKRLFLSYHGGRTHWLYGLFISSKSKLTIWFVNQFKRTNLKLKQCLIEHGGYSVHSSKE